MKPMERRGDETRPISERPSASRLLAETPSVAPPPSSRGRSPAHALAPTVAEWMPVAISGVPSSNGADVALGAFNLRPGVLVDRTYRIERVLGFGGMGVVACAYDERLERQVAIKFIRPELFVFPDMRSFFCNEGRAMARVSHPNVLAVHAFGEHEGAPYFVMEYVEGRTVDQWLRGHAPGTFPDLDEAVAILDQACLGVEAIHAAKTVHRDLKPSNLLIDRVLRVAVSDLGVARILESATGGNYLVGSAPYMAPEAALGEDEAPELASARDIYALGCIAYEVFTLRPPFVGERDKHVVTRHVLEAPAPPSQFRPSLPVGYDEVILKALAKEPRDRYPTVREFRRALLAEHSGAREPERILLADDDADWRALIGEALMGRFPNAVIDQVGDGRAALEAFEREPYSVVLVDLEMPEMDGAKLTLLLRSRSGSERTPILVLTAQGGPREWKRLSEIGADAFLVKPVNAEDLELLIRRTLRSRRSLPPPSPSLSPSSPSSSSPTSDDEGDVYACGSRAHADPALP